MLIASVQRCAQRASNHSRPFSRSSDCWIDPSRLWRLIEKQLALTYPTGTSTWLPVLKVWRLLRWSVWTAFVLRRWCCQCYGWECALSSLIATITTTMRTVEAWLFGLVLECVHACVRVCACVFLRISTHARMWYHGNIRYTWWFPQSFLHKQMLTQVIGKISYGNETWFQIIYDTHQHQLKFATRIQILLTFRP